MSGHAKRALKSIAKHALIYLCLFIVFFPFLWMILASFQTQKDIMNAGKGLLRFQPTLPITTRPSGSIPSVGLSSTASSSG